MILNTHITLIDGRYSVEVSAPANALSAREQEAVYQFGEPIGDMGGEVTGGETTVTLATQQLRIPSQLPFKVTFDIADHEDDAGALADAYVALIRPRIADAVAAKPAETPTATLGLFSGPAIPTP